MKVLFLCALILLTVCHVISEENSGCFLKLLDRFKPLDEGTKEWCRVGRQLLVCIEGSEATVELKDVVDVYLKHLPNKIRGKCSAGLGRERDEPAEPGAGDNTGRNKRKRCSSACAMMGPTIAAWLLPLFALLRNHLTF